MKDIIGAVLLVTVTIVCTPPGWVGMVLMAMIISAMRGYRPVLKEYGGITWSEITGGCRPVQLPG